MHLRWLPFTLLAVALNVAAQNYTISTIAGTGISRGDGGQATAALIFPTGMTTDTAGNMYLSDSTNHIRKVSANGAITLFAGNSDNQFSGDGGPATAAALSMPTELALDGAGNLYVADSGNARVRRIAPNGVIQTVVGNGGCDPATGTSVIVAGSPAVTAPFCTIISVAVDTQNRLFFSGDGRVWRVAADGTLVLVAGTGGFGSTGDNGPATAAQIGYPSTLKIDSIGNLYFGDGYNFNVREVTAADQKIRTVVTPGSNTLIAMAIALDSAGGLYYVATGTTVRKIANGADTVAATVPATIGFGIGIGYFIHIDSAGALYVPVLGEDRLLKFAGGAPSNVAGAYPLTLDPLSAPALNAHLQLSSVDGGLAFDGAGNLYFPELDSAISQRIDKLSPDGTLSGFLGPDFPLDNITFTAGRMVFDSTGALYFSTFSRVYRRDANGTVKAYAGAPGFPTALGDGGPALLAKLTNPGGMVVDANGNLYIAEPFANRVRKVDAGGFISTYAGTGDTGFSGDNGPAKLALLAGPVDLALDAAGNLYIGEISGAKVRKVDRNGIITTVAGAGLGHTFGGDGGPATSATFSGVGSIAIDPSGNLFIVDVAQAGGTFIATPSNERIRMVNTNGIISTIAGTGRSGYNGDNRLASTALLTDPQSIRSDAHGNLYFFDSGNQRIRKLTPGAPPVVIEFYNTILDNYFITANPAEQAAISGGSAGPGWITTGEHFTAGGPSQVCRFYGSLSPGPNSHFYTIDPAECQALKDLQASTPNTQKRWNFESLDFAATIPVGGLCEGGYKPVYRAYNNGFLRGIDSNHRITSSQAAIAEVVARGWSSEGVVMCAPQ